MEFTFIPPLPLSALNPQREFAIIIIIIITEQKRDLRVLNLRFERKRVGFGFGVKKGTCWMISSCCDVLITAMCVFGFRSPNRGCFGWA